MQSSASHRPWLCVIAVAALASTCGSRVEAVHWLRLAQVRPENNVGVFLNERIQLDFSEPLDPTSVHKSSVRIVAADGLPARGELAVDEERLVFWPDPVLAADLSDGGYRPGQTYFVDLAGFPLIDGLRGRSGAQLERNLRLEFRTVEISEPRSGFVFEDSSLARGLRVFLRSAVIAPGEPILLESEEPLDPSTLFADDFVVRRELLDQKQEGRTRPPLSDPIPLRARMLENHDREAPFARGTALIELAPVDQLLEPGRYVLLVDAVRLRLRDFGGNRVRVRSREFSPSMPLEFDVAPRSQLGPEVSTWFLEAFVDARMRSAESLEGFDGTARWSDSGLVEVRWPAAAGEGRDGEVVLAGREPRAEIQATRLTVPAGATCELQASPGLVVVRAQGKLTLAGQLVRRSGAPRTTGEERGLDHTLFVGGTGASKAPAAQRTLSAALEQARQLGLDATILIAGGDLVLEGRVMCDGPLLLVAGGRIRVARPDLVAARRLYVLGDGGDSLVNQSGPTMLKSTLAIDVPAPGSLNPLAAPLRFAVASSSIPREGRAVRWHVAPQVGSHDGIGRARVRYVGERAQLVQGGEREVLVDDPALLSDCPTLRLRVELEVPAGEPGRAWDPPWVDFVLLEFDRTTARDGR